MGEKEKKREMDIPEPLNPWELLASLMMCAVAFTFMAGPGWAGHPPIIAAGALAAMAAAGGRHPTVAEAAAGVALTAWAYVAGQAGAGSQDAMTIGFVSVCTALWAWMDGMPKGDAE